MDSATARTPSARRAFFEDGLGKRYHASGPGGEPFDLLVLRDELAAVPSFEFALRDRVNAFTTFQNTSYARIRGVARLGEGTGALGVASERVRGERLSNVLAVAAQQFLPLELHAALCLIRQLTYAVAMLHEMEGISHGAITPDRIVIAPDGQLVIVDHVFGAALKQLHFSHERHWKELGLPLPNSPTVPRFDQRTDVLQVGAVALALILGRPLHSEEYPGKIGALIEQASGRTATGGFEPLPAMVRTWLARMLQLDVHEPFTSGVEAWAEFDRVFDGGDYVTSLSSLRSFLAAYAACAGTAAAAAPGLTPLHSDTVSSAIRRFPMPAAPATPASVSNDAVPPAASSPITPATPSPASGPRGLTLLRPDTVSFPIRPSSVLGIDFATTDAEAPAHMFTEQEADLHMTNSPSWWRRRWIAAAVVLVALAGGGALAGRWYLVQPAAAEASGTLVVDTNPHGVAVVVDDQPRGFTPVTLALAAGSHVMELLIDGKPRTIPLTITAGGTVSQFIELPNGGALTGRLQVGTEPSGARVTVDGVPRGVSPLVVDGLTPGAHIAELANDLGSVRHEVIVQAGVTATLVVPMLAPQGVSGSGWISVVAPVDVQVYENQRLLGSSRIDRIMVPTGRHELEIVSEALGFRATRIVNVSPDRVSPVRLDWPNGLMAINAQPWAEVWIDGERIGETPIGGLAVPIGPHEVVFRHPEFGEQVVRASVTLTAPTRLSVDLRKR